MTKSNDDPRPPPTNGSFRKTSRSHSPACGKIRVAATIDGGPRSRWKTASNQPPMRARRPCSSRHDDVGLGAVPGVCGCGLIEWGSFAHTIEQSPCARYH